MKQIFLMALLCAMTSSLKAQNTYPFPQSGNVGIGTATPATTLDVYGPIANNRNWLFLAGAGDMNHAIGNISSTDGEQFRFFNFLDLHQTTSDMSRLFINSTGNIGIGTTNPTAALSISNIIPVLQIFDARGNPADVSGMGRVAFGSSNGEFASIGAMRMGNSADDLSALVFKTSYATGAGGDGDNIERMRIIPNGNVGIGTLTPDTKLAVNGTIHSKEVKVDLNGWSDYVFNLDYRLKPLSEIKTYIEQNHHLPEMPSAAEVEKDGLNLGEMNKLLTKKVEELTLYLIQNNLELKQQKQINKSLEDRLKLIEYQLNTSKK